MSAAAIDGRADFRAVVLRLDARTSTVSALAGEALLNEACTGLGRGPAAWAAERAVAYMASLSTDSPFSPEMSLTAVRRGAEAFLLATLLELAGVRRGSSQEHEIHDAVVHQLVGHRVRPETVVTTLRLAQQRWASDLLTAAVAYGATSDLLADLALAVSGCFDRFIDEQTEAYRAESSKLVHEVAQQRRLLVRALLGGHAVDPVAVQRVLGVDVGQVHVGCAMRCETESTSDRARLVRATELIARELGATSVCRHDEGGDRSWAWFSWSPGRRLRHRALDPSYRGLWIGLGSPQHGARGFRRTLLEANDALSVAEHGSARTVHHEDVSMVAMLSRDWERCGWFVTEQLGRLAGSDREMRELRGTLLTYYRSGERLAAAASQLHLHRNTLADRLRRISRLLGRPLDGDTAALQGALVLCEVLEPIVASS